MGHNFIDKCDTADKSSVGLPIEFYNSASTKGTLKIHVEENNIRECVWYDPNAIVNGARRALSRLTATADANYKISTMRFGTGGHVQGDILVPISPSSANESLENESFSKPIITWFFEPEGIETSVRYQVTLEKSEANGSGVMPYTEAGLFCANGVLFARETFPAVVKNSNRRVIFDWTIMF